MRFFPHIIQDTMAQFTPKELVIVLLFFPPPFLLPPLLLFSSSFLASPLMFSIVIPPFGSCDEILATHHPGHHGSIQPQGACHPPSFLLSSLSFPHPTSASPLLFSIVLPPSGSCNEILATHYPGHHGSIHPQGACHCPPLLPSSFLSSSSSPPPTSM